jgi:hypothetical protein
VRLRDPRRHAGHGTHFLTEEDAALDQHPVAIVSGRFWRDRLGRDPAVLQRTLT